MSGTSFKALATSLCPDAVPGAELASNARFCTCNLTARGLVVAAQVPSLHSHRRQLSANEVGGTVTGVLAQPTPHPQSAGTTVIPAAATELWRRSGYLTPEEAAEQLRAIRTPAQRRQGEPSQLSPHGECRGGLENRMDRASRQGGEKGMSTEDRRAESRQTAVRNQRRELAGLGPQKSR